MARIEKSLNIDGKEISFNSNVYFIADIAANHDGSIERAKDLIWKAKEAGADAAKFQHFKAKSIVSDLGFKQLGAQKSHQAQWGKSVYEVYKDAELNFDWTDKLKKTCDEAQISFFTSPYDFDLVDKVDPFVPAYKIGSGDITWIDIIKYIASKDKPYFLACGASSMDDVVRAVEAATEINGKLCLMQCNTNYTGSLENFKFIQLNVLKTFKEMYPDLILGLSDHTPGHTTVLGAVSLGARVIEKHFTDDVRRSGPDHGFSMDPSSWSEMVNRTRELELALGFGVKRIEENEIETAVLQRRAVRASKELLLGTVLTVDDLISLRPCPADGLRPYQLDSIIGKKLTKNKSSGELIKASDFV
jgi:N-acetylneuraminate synthase